MAGLGVISPSTCIPMSLSKCCMCAVLQKLHQSQLVTGHHVMVVRKRKSNILTTVI